MSGSRWHEALNEHARTIDALRDAESVLERIRGALAAALRGGRCVYVIGNGGSAADAQHIAGEMLGRFKRQRLPIPVIALTTDSSTLTAVANDLGYELVFARQVAALARAGDVLWVLTTSGNSPNLIVAAEAARAAGAAVIGFTGRDGGRLAPLCTHEFRVPHSDSDRIQEAHQLAYHYLCEQLERDWM